MKRWRLVDHIRASKLPDEPFVLDTRSADIPETIANMIRSLPDHCRGLSLRTTGGPKMIEYANKVAAERGFRIFWFDSPKEGLWPRGFSAKTPGC